MDDLPPTDESPDAGSGGGLGSFLNNTRNVIGAVTGLIVAVSGLLVALNKVGILGGDDDNGPKTETRPPATIFGPIKRPIGRVYFDGETMYVRAAQPGRPLVHLADLEKPLRDVSMSARVSWVSGASDYGMSFVCRYDNSQNYYLLAVLSGRRYNIARYRNGRVTSLTGGIQRSTKIAEESNDVTARCVSHDPTTLSLEVNGRPVATKQDRDGIESGNVGIRAGSSESFVVFRFEDFQLKYL
ncbi:MAG TPA: hypothetical protein VFA34_05185 [Actinomycetota bacterium]|nr:hypothetical protein [Actinomycetota bacterium]